MAMTNPNIEDKAIDAIMIMNTAIINLRLYPPTNSMINQTLDRLLLALKAILAEEDPLILAESERTLLFGKNPVWSKNQEKAHVRAFVELLVNQGIKSVSFESGLEKEELTAFLQALSKRPEEVRAEGGMPELLAHRNINHIRIDEKFYLAKNITEQNLANMDFKDDIVAFLMGTANTESAEFQQFRENAKDPEWITSVFQTWIMRLKEQQGIVPTADLSDNITRMARMMEKIVDPSDVDRMVRIVTQSVTEMDNETIKVVLTQDIQGLFHGRFFDEIINSLDDGQFTALVGDLAGLAALPDEHGRRAAISLKSMMNTDKGRKLERERHTQTAQEDGEREKRLHVIRERLQGLLKGEEAAFLDQRLMADLPELTRELYALGEGRTADGIIERVADKLRSRHPDLRMSVAETLSQALNNLIADGRTDLSGHLAERLAGWLRSETVFTPACERICLQLKEMERVILNENPFVEANPILDTISSIQSGKHSKDQNMQTMAVEALRELAAEDLLDALFHEFKTNDQGKHKEAAKNLGRLGAAPMERLLNMLRESEDSDERVQILQIIFEIGALAAPAITARMKPDEPWYVLRNLVYALGRIGSEAQVADLAPLLLHDNQKVQQEAIKSLQRIGGNARAGILLSVLPKASEHLKISIIEMLGTIRTPEAVPALVEMLRSKAVVVSSQKADLDEKICIALGNIGSEEALPALMEIAKPKGFFIVRSSPERVKIAAGKAVASITKRKS
jgi:HEAT repeat protein